MQAKHPLNILAGSILAMLSTGALAVATWDLSSCVSSGTAYGNTQTCTTTAANAPVSPTPVGEQNTATATAWANDTGNPIGATGSLFRSAYLHNWGGTSGLAVVSQTEGGNSVTQPTSPQHAMDNNGSTELISFSFGAGNLVALSQVVIGWGAYDRDISILMCTTNCGDTSALGTQSIDSLRTGGGWELVHQYDGATASTSGSSTDKIVSFNTDYSKKSSWWLVSAYNANYGTGTAYTTSDYVKIYKIAGTVTKDDKVPEPGSMALLGVGLLGLLRASRKNKQ